MKNKVIMNKLNEKITDTLVEFNINIREEDKLIVINKAYGDLMTFAQKDPSSHGNALYILESYLSFQSVLMYRLANMIAKSYDIFFAKRLSEMAKLKTGIEIHPSASIGNNFVLDHGIGTVIGETVTMGNNCYLLQNVILGSTNIANNKSGVRHPQIGNNVEIGGFVRIYGNITIGNNVKISPHSIIRHSIPNNSTVILGCDYQVVKNCNNNGLLFKGYRDDEDYLTLFFNNLDEDIKCYLDGIITEFELYANKILIRKKQNKKHKRITIKSSKNEELRINI